MMRIRRAAKRRRIYRPEVEMPEAICLTSVLAGAPDRGPIVIAAGLSQLDRYLARAWHRARVALERHGDCTQAVYLALIEDWGPDRFRRVIAEITERGVSAVFRRETPEGPGFFKAVDRIKKQAQRARGHLSLDDVETPIARREDRSTLRSAALRDALDRKLSRREASLIASTLAGETASEIAADRGVMAKTISNEKSRIVSKLRSLIGPRG